MLVAVATYPARRAMKLCGVTLLFVLLSPAFAELTENKSRRDLQIEWDEAAPRYYGSTGQASGYDDNSASSGYDDNSDSSATANGGKKGDSMAESDGKKGDSMAESDGKKGDSMAESDGKKGDSVTDSDGKKGDSVTDNGGKKGDTSGNQVDTYNSAYGYDDDDDDIIDGDDDDDIQTVVCEPNYAVGDDPCVVGCGHAPVPNPFNPNPVEAEKEQLPGPCKDYGCLCADSGCKMSWDVGCIKWYMQCQTQTQVCGSLADAPDPVKDFNIGASCTIAPISANTEYCFPMTVSSPTPAPRRTPAPFGPADDDDDDDDSGTAADDDSGKKGDVVPDAGKKGDTGADDVGKKGDTGADDVGGKKGDAGADDVGGKKGDAGADDVGGKKGDAGADDVGGKKGDAGADIDGGDDDDYMDGSGSKPVPPPREPPSSIESVYGKP